MKACFFALEGALARPPLVASSPIVWFFADEEWEEKESKQVDVMLQKQLK